MKKFLFLIFATTLFVTSSYSQYTQPNKTNNPDSNKQPVLLELFTSESCAACPSAEEMLTKLETEQPFSEAELITLEYHVDYKDGFGRKDIYASPLFTQRQKVYNRQFRTGKIYTPQMVVDGSEEFIGSKFDIAEKAVEKSLKNKKADVKLSVENLRLNVKISNLSKHGYATVYLAIAEDGITTRNRVGENAANVSVVRRLNGLGRILPTQDRFELDTNFQIQENWKKENIKLIVFIQENGNRLIHGVGRVTLKSTNEDRKL